MIIKLNTKTEQAALEGMIWLETHEDCDSVTVFLSPYMSNPKERVLVTRDGENQLRITIGRLNFREREWVKRCKKANASVRRIKPW